MPAPRVEDDVPSRRPSVVAGSQLLHPSNSFGMDGYLALLVGQNVPHDKPYVPSQRELDAWRSRINTWSLEARRAMTVKEALDAMRKPGMRWA